MIVPDLLVGDGRMPLAESSPKYSVCIAALELLLQ